MYMYCLVVSAKFLPIDHICQHELSLVWPDPIPHRGKGSGTWPQSNLLPRNLISHVNLVMMSAMAIAKVRLVTFLHSQFQFLLCSSSWLKTLLTLQVDSLFKLKFWIFPLITYFRYPITEYCAVIGMHSTVRGNKLFYGHVPDPFPWCGIGSGHARLAWAMQPKCPIVKHSND